MEKKQKGPGRPRLYNVELELGELRAYPNAPNAETLINAAKAYTVKRNLGWRFRSVVIERETPAGVVRVLNLIRTK